MTPIHRSFPKIKQFRNVISDLKHFYQFEGNDEYGNPIYNHNTLPKVNFYGTTKAHGTNACIAQMCANGKLFYQSRERLLTPKSDNHKFAEFMENDKQRLQEWFILVRDILELPDDHSLYIYGEWCGGNIQGGVALHGLDRMFLVFAIRSISPDERGKWILPHHVSFMECMPLNSILYVWDINTFGHYQIEVDLNQPELSQNEIAKLVESVETQCPIGNYFNKNGTGEGIVFYVPELGLNYSFKAKGEKHSASKVRTVAAVDVERITQLNDLIALIVTENRLNQMAESLDRKIENIGPFLKKILSDCIEEELDTIENNGFTSKEFCAYASRVAKTWWMGGC